MLDLSDGLAGDLRHILNASHVGAELLSRAVPVSRAARSRRREEAEARANTQTPPPHVGGYSPLLAALTDGEDFELLFTVASNSAVRLLDAWKEKFPKLKLSCIGKITSEPGLRLRDARGVQNFKGVGYDHFA